jgi:hypothetical protein
MCDRVVESKRHRAPPDRLAKGLHLCWSGRTQKVMPSLNSRLRSWVKLQYASPMLPVRYLQVQAAARWSCEQAFGRCGSVCARAANQPAAKLVADVSYRMHRSRPRITAMQAAGADSPPVDLAQVLVDGSECSHQLAVALVKEHLTRSSGLLLLPLLLLQLRLRCCQARERCQVLL